MTDGLVYTKTVCGPCALYNHMMARKSQLLAAGASVDEAPVFAEKNGQVLRNMATIEGWRTLQTKDGSKRVTGHSARRSGAKTLARLGWDMSRMGKWGRWGSETVQG